jgi:Protein of unknown function (DUF3455)
MNALAWLATSVALVVTPPAVPGNLQVEDGNKAFLIAHASGTQNYVCLPSATGFAYVAPGAIPWLLLRVAGAQYGPADRDKLATATFIQRVNTAGGAAAASGCASAADVGKKVLVPYSADYVFYKPAN